MTIRAQSPEFPRPDRWEGRPAKRLFDQRRTRADASDVLLTASQSHGVIAQDEYERLTGNRVTKAASNEGLKKVVSGDFVISLRTFQGGIELSHASGCISPAYTVLVPTKHVDAGFFRYLLKSDPFLSILSVSVTGVRDGKTVRFNDFSGLVLPVPTPGAQARIADFLDRETAHIDTLIEKKERLIRLLDEKRAALITQAVTKGLNPDAPMKDSGVEWIGEIPEHWDTAPIGGLFDVQLGKMLDASRETGRYLRPYLRNQDVQWGRVNTESLPEMDFRPFERSRFALQTGDLLVCEGGDVGRTAMWDGALEECYYQKAIHRIRPASERSVPRFLFYVMRHLANAGAFLAGSNPNTIPHLTAVQLRRHRMTAPPREEALEVAAQLDRETGILDRVKETASRSILLLRERRAALITAAVTGQLDIPADPS